MTVSTIASIAASLARVSGNQNTRNNALLTSLFTPAADMKKSDSTDFSATISLQNQVAQLRVASQNVAQAGSLLAAAEAGAGQIVSDLDQLEKLATRAAAPATTDDERIVLGSQFATIRNRIDTVAKSAKFNNEALLDGSSAQLKLANDNKNIKDLSIGSLTDAALFKGRTPDVATLAGAKATQDLVKEAKAYATKQLENVRALQNGLDLAASTLQSAIQNQDASRSTLSEADFTTQLFAASNPLGGNDALSALAQTKRLPPSMLQLITE